MSHAAKGAAGLPPAVIWRVPATSGPRTQGQSCPLLSPSFRPEPARCVRGWSSRWPRPGCCGARSSCRSPSLRRSTAVTRSGPSWCSARSAACFPDAPLGGWPSWPPVVRGETSRCAGDPIEKGEAAPHETPAVCQATAPLGQNAPRRRTGTHHPPGTQGGRRNLTAFLVMRPMTHADTLHR